jgi:hypothetical protein
MTMNCLSCGDTENPESGEHVFSKWLLEHLKAVRKPIEHFRYSLDGGKSPHLAQMSLNSFRLKRICQPCNNGWMSRLENQAKPIVIGLMSGTLNLESLDDEQRRILARWAGKTALVESYAVGAEVPVDPKILHRMRHNEEGPPGKFGVLGLTTDFESVGHMQLGLITDLVGGGSIAANVVILMLPNLILICGFPWEVLPCRYHCDLQTYVPIWPERRHWTRLTPDTPPLPKVSEDPEFLLALAEKIEFEVLYR